ncbi:MAG: hypothetical protein PV344_03570, partial [Anaplasma sp.]|nr:hypothetical protein [Anaplasma sp.]
MRNSVRQKRPDLWEGGEWWFHHNNAPGTHCPVSATIFEQKWHDTASSPPPPPPYSPDLTPCVFFLFARMKKVLEGKFFVDVEEVKQKIMEP